MNVIVKKIVSVTLLAGVFGLSVGSAIPEQCSSPTHETAGACCELAGSTHASLSDVGIGADCGCTLNEGTEPKQVPSDTVLAETIAAKTIGPQFEVCQTGLQLTISLRRIAAPVAISHLAPTTTHLPIYTLNSSLLI